MLCPSRPGPGSCPALSPGLPLGSSSLHLAGLPPTPATRGLGGCQIRPLFSGCSWFLREQEKEGQDVALNEAGRK